MGWVFVGPKFNALGKASADENVRVGRIRLGLCLVASNESNVVRTRSMGDVDLDSYQLG